ncbi:MAG: LptA/OstA family protein [Candidatus Margulisiibacteriota bacterium]
MNRTTQIAAAVFFAAAAALGLLYLILPDIDLMGDKRAEKVLEIYGTRAVGWSQGKKTFELTSSYGWANRFQDKACFEEVKDGSVFQDNKVVIKNIKTGRVEVNTSLKETSAFGGPGSAKRASALVDLKGKGDFSRFSFNSMKYDHRTERASFFGSPLVLGKDLTLSCTTLEVFYLEKRSRLMGNVLMKTKGTRKKNTAVRSSAAEVFNETGNISFFDGVSVIQKDKKAFCDLMSYDTSASRMVLTGNTKIVFKSAPLIKKERLKSLRNPETKKALESETELNCSSFDLSLESGNAVARGGVTVKQKGQQAKSDSALYNEDKETISLFGNVLLKRRDEWLKTKKVVVHLKGERFEAEGDVETLFKLKK